jgi:hypothetical protein
MFTKTTIALAIIVGVTSGALAATKQRQHNPNPTWDTYTYPPKQAHQSANPTWDDYYTGKKVWEDPSVDMR